VTPIVQLRNVVRRFRTARSSETIEALRVERLDVGRGEILAVVGANGCGKSTLLETAAFLARPDEGHVLLDGHDVWSEGRWLAARRRCPMLLQHTVLWKSTVIGNVMYPLLIRGVARAAARRQAEDVLRRADLAHLTRRTYRELSGGERQRVALARLLVVEAHVLLLDEPTAHVDRASAERIEQLIRQMHEKGNLTVVLATHDAQQAQSLAHRVVTLDDGTLPDSVEQAAGAVE